MSSCPPAGTVANIRRMIRWLKQQLQTTPNGRSLPLNYRAAAVLLPLYEQNGRFHLLYTRRTDLLPTHKGQVAFPGGKLNGHEETAVAAALRETHEEVGILPHDVEVLGCLEPVETNYGRFVVTPVVGRIPWPYPLQINRAEVATTFGVPLPWLLNPANIDYQAEHRYTFRPYAGETIWGLTGWITTNFLQLLQPAVNEIED